MKKENNNSNPRCKYCNKPLVGKRSNAKFCNPTCKSRYHNQIKLGKISLPHKLADDFKTPGLQRTSSDEKEKKIRKIKSIELQKTICYINLERTKKLRKAKELELSSLNSENIPLKTIIGGLGSGIIGGMVFNNNLAGLSCGLIGGVIANSFEKKIPNDELKAIHNKMQELSTEILRIDSTIKEYYKQLLQYDLQVFELKNPNFIKKTDANKKGGTQNTLNNINSSQELLEKSNNSQNKHVVNSQELLKIDYPEFTFEGKYLELFGKPATNFNCNIYGKKPGDGKTTFALVCANYFATNFGTVIFFSAEEGHSKTIQDKVRRLGITTKKIHFADFRTFEQIESELKENKYHFIFIDSLNTLKIGPEEMKMLRQMLPNNAFITISQSTKDGKMRGSNEINHDCDIEIQVVDGVASIIKNRHLEDWKEFKVF